MKKTFTFAALATAVMTAFATPAAAGSGNAGYFSDSYVTPGHSQYFEEFFYGGEVAAIELSSHYGEDVDLFIFDHLGNEIAYSDSYSGNERIQFRPAYDGYFTIEVYNADNRGADFSLWTN